MSRNTDRKGSTTDGTVIRRDERTNINFRADIRKFTESEREAIKAARKVTGVDRPTFYHDSIVSYAESVIRGTSNG